MSFHQNLIHQTMNHDSGTKKTFPSVYAALRPTTHQMAFESIYLNSHCNLLSFQTPSVRLGGLTFKKSGGPCLSEEAGITAPKERQYDLIGPSLVRMVLGPFPERKGPRTPGGNPAITIQQNKDRFPIKNVENDEKG